MQMPGPITGVVIPVFLSLIPGWGHIWVRRTTRGLALFLLFFASLDYAIVRELIDETGGALDARLARGAAAAVFVFTFLDIGRITLWSRSAKVRKRRELLLRRLVGHYLRDELGQAEDASRQMLRLDPYDATALVYLGMVQKAGNRPVDAARTWRKALLVDRGRHWAPDIERELHLISGRT